MDFVHYIYRKHPKLKRNLVLAHMKINPLKFIKKSLINAILMSVALGIFSIFIIDRFFLMNNINLPSIVTPLISIFIIMPILFIIFFPFILNTPISLIKKRKEDIDKDVLFAGRYLLIKLNSGQPLFNALIDGSRSYGVASKYFKEIVDDVNLGMPLEEAIERSMILSPSNSFQKILFQINNSLKIGVDVSDSLKGVIDEITSEQMTQIQAYSHKLNSVAMFYMLAAIVGPSLGLTVFILIVSLIGFNISLGMYVILWFFIVLIQLIFINVFRGIRPNINF
jgi:pilus assembly protein TadC